MTRGIQIIDDVDTVSAIVGTEVVDPTYLDKSGGSLIDGEPYKGIAGDGFESDEEMINELDPSDIGRFQREKDRLEQVMEVEENNIKPQLADPNVPVLNYRIIGQWTNPQQQEILERMVDMDYQPIIAEKYNTGSSRIAIENYLLILLGTTEDDIKTADKEYRKRANKGTLIRANPKREDEINIDYLKKRIEDQEFFIKDKEKKIADGEIPRNEGLTNQGRYFENKTSQGHFEPWVRDHQLEKIEWVNQSWRNPLKEPIVSNVESPKPTTDTPTPNRQPTWTWQPIKDATVYEVIFQDVTTLTHDTYFKSPSRLARNKEYTILVKAGKPNQSGTGTDWSVSGRHTVKIDKNALPPKPPKCPYAVGGLGEKDQYGRMIGLLFEDQPMDLAIERNEKMWCGDVMAYITAKEDVGSLTFPCDPNNVQKNKVGNFGFTTTYEQSKMTWSETKDKFLSPGVYGKEISPTNLNGNFLGDNQSLTYTYEGVFDLSCGPTLFDPTGGGEVTSPPEKPLDIPKPNSQETTSNPKPEWRWDAIKEATVYRVSLEKVNYSSNGTISTLEDYGVISYSELTKATPLLNLKEGTYRVSVIAEKKENEKVVKKSEPGYHVVVVENPKPITQLSTPKPNSRTPTADKTIIWKWEDIANAKKYKVDLNMVVKSTNVATGEVSWNIDTEIGELQDSTSLEFKFDASVEGNYEITVVAYNNDLESEPGRHVVEINSDLSPTPSPTLTPSPVDTYCHEPEKYLVNEPGYCPRDNRESSRRALEKWYNNAFNYCFCRAVEKEDLNRYQYDRNGYIGFRIDRYLWNTYANNRYADRDAPGQMRTEADLHMPQNITSQVYPSTVSIFGPSKAIEVGRGKYVPWSKLYKYWSQYGFTFSEPGKEVPANCLPNPNWTPTPTPHPSGPFRDFVENTKEFSSTERFYKYGDIVYYPIGSKQKFLNSYDPSDGALEVQEGINKYKAQNTLSIYQVSTPREQLPSFYESRKTVNGKICVSTPQRNKIPRPGWKAYTKAEIEDIRVQLQKPSSIEDFSIIGLGQGKCDGMGMTENEAAEFILKFPKEDGTTPDKSPYWSSIANGIKFNLQVVYDVEEG